MLQLYVTLQTLAGSLRDRLDREETGATAVEYGLMVAAIAAVIVTIVVTLGETIETAFETVVDELP